MQREPNPWGLYDVYGNVWEFNADWYYLYPEGLEVDPPGATTSSDVYRTARGGGAWDTSDWVVASGRGGLPIGASSGDCGLRVALPVSEVPSGVL